MKIIEFLDDHEWACAILATFIIMATICIFLNIRIAKLYKVQADIVIHDYGHIYENINDWKLERIEKLEKEIKKDV